MNNIRISKNHKFKSQQKFNEVKSFRFYTGIVIGLISSFTIYSSTFIIRESLRLFSRTEDCDVWSFTDSEMNFYNFFFAFISIVIAQSITINFWLNKPRPFLGRYEYKRKIIINEQRTLNWYFISWFSKVSFLFVLFFVIVIPKGYYTIDFYSEYKYLFNFILIVLFLQTWNSLRITFLKRSLLKMLLFAILMSLLSFGLSKIIIVDYKKLDESYKQSCCEECIPDNLLRVKYYDKLYRRLINIYLNEKTLYSPDSLIKVNREKISLVNIKKQLNYLNHSYISRRPVMLYIDSNIKIKDVNFLKSFLAENEIRNIAYAVLPENMKHDKKYYSNYGVPSRISHSYLNDSLIKQFFIIQNVKQSPNLNLKADSVGNVFLDEVAIDDDSLSRAIKTKVYNNNKLLCVIELENEMTFGTYFKMWYAYYEAIYELRNEHAAEHYTSIYKNLDNDKKYTVLKEYPFRIFEITDKTRAWFEQ